MCLVLKSGGKVLIVVVVVLEVVCTAVQGEQEMREPCYDGRASHGFAEECRSGTGLGHFLRRRRRPAAAMIQPGRYVAG